MKRIVFRNGRLLRVTCRYEAEWRSRFHSDIPLLSEEFFVRGCGNVLLHELGIMDRRHNKGNPRHGILERGARGLEKCPKTPFAYLAKQDAFAFEKSRGLRANVMSEDSRIGLNENL